MQNMMQNFGCIYKSECYSISDSYNKLPMQLSKNKKITIHKFSIIKISKQRITKNMKFPG